MDTLTSSAEITIPIKNSSDEIELVKYKITQSCTDENLVNSLKDQGKLDKDVNKKYTLKCEPNISYIGDKLLGSGSFNEVYSIKDDSSKVIRITKPNVRSDLLLNELLGLFLQSYMSKSVEDGGIGCPYICNVHEFGVLNQGSSDQRVYAILESLPKSELWDEINMLQERSHRVSVLPPGFLYMKKHRFLGLKKVFQQVLEALNCMYKNRYVHLDIKSNNIGLDVNGNAKIFDFGFARYMPSYRLLKQDSVGTYFYMDPNFRDNNVLSINSDIYSVGAMILETYYNFIEDPDKYIIVSPVYDIEKGWDKFHIKYYDNEEDEIIHSDLTVLVKKLLYPDPLIRISAEDALNEKWFTRQKNKLEDNEDVVKNSGKRRKIDGGYRTYKLKFKRKQTKKRTVV